MGREMNGTQPGIWMLMSLAVVFMLSAFFINPAMSRDGDIGANCTATNSCTNALSTCDNGTCLCNSNLTANLEKQLCEAGYYEYCWAEANGGGCSVLNSICEAINATKRCRCKKGYAFDETKAYCVGKGTLLTASVLIWIIGAAISIALK
ncbi:uncharacterized protein LOC124163691 [Ischnura elegans]|uniref:uncharacterized protein LOC124163691 n=1 Tax=Ischnura elegans TaxID=197161 RepID=UPI001ED87DA3|nr:uncharacterized protein LOC124163691 [Ischnura elegans]XP_046396714.1 uncharacterized protein LOC124163691 [Ischnura elegans]